MSFTLSVAGDLRCTLCRVCKKFHAVFEESTPVIFSTLCLSMSLKQHSMPDMYKWIHKYGGIVQSLVASVGTPWLEASLGVLAAHHSCAGSTPRLTEIILADIPSASMTLLAQFSSITTMTLDSNHSTNAHSLRTELDLSDLQNLPHLVMLSLQDGKFEELNTAQHLT